MMTKIKRFSGAAAVAMAGGLAMTLMGAAPAWAASMTTCPTTVASGENMLLKLQGFGAAETITVADKAPSGTSTQSATTRADQGGAKTLTVTSTTGSGQHTLTATGATSHSTATANYSLTSPAPLALCLNQTNAAPGDSLTFVVDGFFASNTVDLRLDSATAKPFSTQTINGTKGTGTGTFPVPNAASGQHTVFATQGTNQAQTPLTIGSTASTVPPATAPPASTPPATTPPASTTSRVPVTGSSTMTLAAGGLMATILGWALVDAAHMKQRRKSAVTAAMRGR